MTRRDTAIQIRLSTEEKERLTEAAGREHMTLGAWLRELGVRELEAKQPITDGLVRTVFEQRVGTHNAEGTPVLRSRSGRQIDPIDAALRGVKRQE